MATAEGELNARLSESYVTARNDFFHRIVKWFYKDATLSKTSEPEFQTPDIAVLVCLLQTIGFDLHHIESLPGGSPAQKPGQEPRTSLSVNITCAQSGLHAVLRSRSSTETSAINSSDSTTRQANIQDTVMARSLLPVVAPGTARVAREVISQLMQLLSGGEGTATRPQNSYSNWTCPQTTQQLERSPCQRHRSLDAFFPVDSSTTNTNVRPQSLPLTSGQIKMEAEDVAATMSASHKAFHSYPTSPVLGGNSLPKPELIRQKTWSIGSIHDMEDAQAVMLGPPLTSSPLQSQQTLQSLEQLNVEGRDPEVAERLHDACAKIHEALSILNLNQKNKAQETSASHASRSKIKQVEAVPKLRPRKTSKPTLNGSDNSSFSGSLQRASTVKRQRSPAPRTPILGRKDMATPKPVKRSATTFTPLRTPHAPRKTKENEARGGSFMNIPEITAGSPNVSQRTSSSAPDPQIRETISPAGASLRPHLSRRASSSLPASCRTSNLTSAFSTPKLRGVLKKATLTSALRMPSTSAPNISGTSNAPREGPKSVLRPSLLKAPSIINRFKK
ncbi:serine/arginine repetitive matrix protein 1 [Cryptotermes secundus]|uniref:serine/arginine repetitive matrix protein 1 n=1 Tax=Cryptotermes secundus TaxID=105785 RepID=UPI000CD7D639|nr:serine/arginine repetitive matrix protein 1 [Cryptotermes secundus]